MSEENKNEQCDCGCEEHTHNHEHGDACGCGHEQETVKLTFEDGKEVECNILGIFGVDDKEYIALLPLGEDEIIIYRYAEIDGQAKLDQIENDEEYEKAGKALFELFEDEEDEGKVEV